MKKVFMISFPLALIILSIVIMTSGSCLKKPTGEQDNFIKFLMLTKEDILKEDWNSAMQNIQKAQNAYRIVVGRIQFSVERDEINQIEDNISRTKGFLLTKNVSGAMAEVMEAFGHWDELEE